MFKDEIFEIVGHFHRPLPQSLSAIALELIGSIDRGIDDKQNSVLRQRVLVSRSEVAREDAVIASEAKQSSPVRFFWIASSLRFSQ
jgi:hypothetical protein